MFGVRPGWQGRGLGQEILTEAERLAREEWGAATMIMTVLVQRLDLIAWYLGSTGSGMSAILPYLDAGGIHRHTATR
jgi:GNAT superfamily N-acetyltransferase